MNIYANWCRNLEVNYAEDRKVLIKCYILKMLNGLIQFQF